MSTNSGNGEVLGWGTFTRTLRGWDELLDRPVAVRTLVQPFAGSEAFVRAYFAQALRMLDIVHPNLLAIYSIEPNRFPPSLRRELGEQPLSHRLFDGPLAPDEVVRVVRHALAGLAALHARDVLHLAVRPENLLASGNLYKLGDFGVVPGDGMPAIPARQLKYSAPELRGTEPRPTAASDLYSLGLVACELLLGSERLERLLEDALADGGASAGGRPEGDRLWLAYHSSAAELPPLHEVESELPPATSLVLARMLRKDPAARPQSAREALGALGTPPRVEGPAATASHQQARPRPETAAQRRPLSGGGVVAAVALAGAALWFVFVDRPRSVPPASVDEVVPIGPGPAIDPPPAEHPHDPAADLLRRARDHQGLTLELAPPSRGGGPVAVGTPLRFLVESDRPGFAVLFALSSTGTLTCLYPTPAGRAPRVVPGRSLVLPRPEDERAGFELVATPPLGTDLVFALVSERPPPQLPPGVASRWVTDYAFDPVAGGPAIDFSRWIEGLMLADPDGVRLTVRRLEVVAR